MMDRTPYRQQKTGQHQNKMTRKELYGVMSTIISPFFPGHRVLLLPSLLLSIWCSDIDNKRLGNTETR
jgi:hypothetical protein